MISILTLRSMTRLLRSLSSCLMIIKLICGCLLCVFFLLSSLPRESLVSVVFDFNASLNVVAPVFPIVLPVDVKRKRKKWIVDVSLLGVFCLLSSPLILSAVSVVFDFNDSLNDAAPLSPISLSVDEKKWFVDGYLLYVFLSFVFHNTDRVL